MIIVILCVDDIGFRSTIDLLSKQFVTKMKKEFEMSMLGELSFFLRMQVC